MEEIELTFLAKSIPKDLKACNSKEIIDIYIPKSKAHPKIRIRKDGNKYEITKKQPLKDGDASHQTEHTIPLTEEEFLEISKINGKKVRKIRYNYPHNNRIAEIDVFQDELKGLIVIDFEFNSLEEKENFQTPDFCLADITQEDFIAGGMICGKSYEDIEEYLEKYGYEKLTL